MPNHSHDVPNDGHPDVCQKQRQKRRQAAAPLAPGGADSGRDAGYAYTWAGCDSNVPALTLSKQALQ